MLRRLADVTQAKHLSDEDIDNIKVFNLKLKGHLSRRLHDYIRISFGNRIKFDTAFLLHRRIAALAGIVEKVYDCCVGSCCAFTGELSQLTACPYCKEPRYDAANRPRQLFRCIPLEPRLAALYANEGTSELMRYRNNYKAKEGVISDVFDGRHYRELREKKVVVDGKKYGHRFFSGKRDVALSVMTDGFQIFKRQRSGSQTCWPILALNLNLPPEIRTHLSNIIPLAIIPGPKAPFDYNSFLRPFVEECKVLASVGVQCVDAKRTSPFTLRAYPISCHGDMPAVKHCMCFKGHNGIRPCRACEIKAVRNTANSKSTYYVPLRQPNIPGQEQKKWNPHHLPLRTAERIEAQLQDIEMPQTKAVANEKRTQYGINGRSVLFELPSISPTMSFPHEWMHLFLERHEKSLTDIWMGRYKGLDEGKEEYILSEAVWTQIGKETAAAGATIPSAFGRRTPNIATERHIFTAEDWGFWFVHIAPHVLKGRFPKDKFYNHFMKLNFILRQTLKFSITLEEVEELRELTCDYVCEYEK